MLKQNGSVVASTTTSATFAVRSGICTAQLILTANAAGAVGDIVIVPTGLPAPKATTGRHRARGQARWSRVGVNFRVGPPWWSSSVANIECGQWVTAPAIASTDIFSVFLKYPVA